MPASYRIRRILKGKKVGITAPAACTLDAILKFDCEESPYCVYNELVAVRLARLIQAPVADGVLVGTDVGPAYASLELGSRQIQIPNLGPGQARSVSARYPRQAGAVVAFDLWICNWDRGGNIKASLVTPHIPLFGAFDHSHALLMLGRTAYNSTLMIGNGSLHVQTHPFYGYVKKEWLDYWVKHIESLPDGLIREVCELREPFRQVSEQTQQALATSLIRRKADLARIVAANLHIIKPVAPK